MEFFDTHSHYNDEAYDEDRKELINEIYKEGITKTVVIGYNIEKSKKAIEIAEENKFMYSAIGIHPSDIGRLSAVTLTKLLPEPRNLLVRGLKGKNPLKTNHFYSFSFFNCKFHSAASFHRNLYYKRKKDFDLMRLYSKLHRR